MNDFISQHPALAVWFVGLLFTLISFLITVVGWFLVKTLRRIESGLSSLFTNLSTTNSSLDRLWGEHNAFQRMGGCVLAMKPSEEDKT